SLRPWAITAPNCWTGWQTAPSPRTWRCGKTATCTAPALSTCSGRCAGKRSNGRCSGAGAGAAPGPGGPKAAVLGPTQSRLTADGTRQRREPAGNLCGPFVVRQEPLDGDQKEFGPSETRFRRAFPLGGDGGTRTPDLHGVKVIMGPSAPILQRPKMAPRRTFRHLDESPSIR